MILGMSCGGGFVEEEFGARSSERRIASAEASSKRSVIRVKTLRMERPRSRKAMRRKTRSPRRMVLCEPPACERFEEG